MNIALIAAMMVTAPPVGEPAPRVDLPRGLESAQWEDLWVDHCKERMTEAGHTTGFYFSGRNRVQERKINRRESIYCHVPQASLWTYGPTGIRYFGFTLFSCPMALAMARFEVIAQEEARRIFESPHANPIRSITHMGTYNCRSLRRKPERQSQHSFGNAIDFRAFNIHGYGVVEVETHWTPRTRRQVKGSEFLHALVARLKEEQVFTNLLDPTWDAFHHNHIHADVAPLSFEEPSPALARVRTMTTGDAELDAASHQAVAAAWDAWRAQRAEIERRARELRRAELAAETDPRAGVGGDAPADRAAHLDRAGERGGQRGDDEPSPRPPAAH